MTDEQYDHEAILDDARLGNEPSDDYLEHVKFLDDVVRNCMHVSRGYGYIRSPTSQHFYASVLFTVLVTRGVSLMNLIPHTPWAEKLIEHWDYASAAGIARTMLEVRLALHYLCVDPCSREEWECRWNVFNLHDCRARKRFFEERGAESSEIEGFEGQAEELRERLRANAYFLSLPQKQQTRFLSGHVAYFIPLEKIGEQVGFKRSDFRWIYAFLSSHVHALPMSFYRMGGHAGDGRGRGLPTPVEEHYTSLCISLAATLLVGARDEIHTLFVDYKKPEAETRGLNADIEEAEEEIETFPIGEVRTFFQSDVIRIEAVRVSDTAVSLSYYFVPTNEAVLRRTMDDANANSLDWYDRSFWTIAVDGGPATDTMLAGICEKRMAFKIDHENRTISFKLS